MEIVLPAAVPRSRMDVSVKSRVPAVTCLSPMTVCSYSLLGYSWFDDSEVSVVTLVPDRQEKTSTLSGIYHAAARTTPKRHDLLLGRSSRGNGSHVSGW